jgi:hypothetical protein
MDVKDKPCVCNGKETIQFQGSGIYLKYMICPQVGTGEHKSIDECEKEYKQRAFANYPKSGRFA